MDEEDITLGLMSNYLFYIKHTYLVAGVSFTPRRFFRVVYYEVLFFVRKKLLMVANFLVEDL